MNKSISLSITFCLFIMISCSGDDSKDDPKEMNKIIPPDSTVAINLSTLFNESFPSKEASDNPAVIRAIDAAEQTCINKARGLVGWGAAVCYTPFVIPVAIFNLLRTQVPTVATSKRVEWSFTGENHSASVTAIKNGGEYDWEWTIVIDEFTWITGGSMENLTGGWWQYHKAELPADADNLILITWNRVDNVNYDIKFTNNNDDPATAVSKGDYLLLIRTDNDISVEFYDIIATGGIPARAIVLWNISTLAGEIDLEQGTFPLILNSSCAWDPAD